MGKYWDWYEVEFERVARNLTFQRREDILEALRDHVREATSEFAATQSEEEAERLAVKNLGSPTDLVRAELDTGRRQWLPVWLAGLGVAWCAAWMIVGSTEWTGQMIIAALWFTPISVFIATLVSKRTKFWALGVTVASIGAATLGAMGFSWLNLQSAGGEGVLPRWQVAREVKFVENEMTGLSSRLTTLESVEAAFKVGDIATVKEIVFRSGVGWEAPTAYWRGDERQFTWVPTADLAKAAWAAHGQSAIQRIKQKLERAERFHAALYDPRAVNPLGWWKQNWQLMFVAAAGTYSFLGLCHGLGLLFVRLPGYLARRRWRVAL